MNINIQTSDQDLKNEWFNPVPLLYLKANKDDNNRK